MESVVAPDGKKYELKYTSKVSGPDSSGWSLNTDYLWFRVDGGEWQYSEIKQMHKAVKAIEDGRASELTPTPASPEFLEFISRTSI